MEGKVKNVLLVDDEAKFLKSISKRISLMGFEPLNATNGREALEIAKKTMVDLAIVDLKMPDMDGLVTIAKLKEMRPQIRTILLTGHGSEKIRQATEALDSAYFQKDEMGDLWNLLRGLNTSAGIVVINPPAVSGKAAVEALAQPDEIHRLQNSLNTHEASAESYPLEGYKLIGETPGMQELKKNIARVAVLDCAVLIRGEKGTGKELVARTVHHLSPRRRNPFLAVNCGSFSQELLSNELFGQEQEASPHSRRAKEGVFEANSGGSILFDEIGDTPYPMQGQLLRVLQEKTIVREGGTENRPVDVRIMAATSQSLEKRLDKKEFREDLYNHLNGFELLVPPLRDRRDDISPLCSYFIDKSRKEFDKEVESISDEVLSIFMDYSFPNNVRELESIIERAVILSDGLTIEREHLPERLQAPEPLESKAPREFMSLAELEAKYIIEVLEATGGNKSKAGEILGISRGALWRKLKRLTGDKG